MGNTTADNAGGMNNGMISGATWIKPGAPDTGIPTPPPCTSTATTTSSRSATATCAATTRRSRSASGFATPPTRTAPVCVCRSPRRAGRGAAEARLQRGPGPGLEVLQRSAGVHRHPRRRLAPLRVHLRRQQPPAVPGRHARAMSTTNPDNGPPTNVRLGAIFNNAENFQGDLDDVRFYNRAISAAEVTALAQGFE